MSRVFACILLTVLTASSAVLAGEKKNGDKPDPKTAYTNIKDAGVDYQVQGEYAAEVKSPSGESVTVGVQIIALGDGKFRAVGYHGGLPGDGWDGKERHSVEGKLVDDSVVFRNDNGTEGVWNDGVISIRDKDGNALGKLKKVERKSETLGKKPPEGAVVLFDGKSADAFKGGRMTKDGLLMVGVTSTQTFGDCTLHAEFRTPFMPYARGQGRGNSGCYLQGRYEIQILDSFGLEGKHNECGGIYSVKDPDVNMCFPPLRWQTYDIDYTAARYKDGEKVKNARMTVRHNGVLIHKDVELPKGTTAHPVKEGPEPGPVYLQNHGNPVHFRNIWVVEKKAE